MYLKTYLKTFFLILICIFFLSNDLVYGQTRIEAEGTAGWTENFAPYPSGWGDRTAGGATGRKPSSTGSWRARYMVFGSGVGLATGTYNITLRWYDENSETVSQLAFQIGQRTCNGPSNTVCTGGVLDVNDSWTANATAATFSVRTYTNVNLTANDTLFLFARLNSNSNAAWFDYIEFTSVSNNPSTPVMNNQVFTINENSSNGTSVGNMAATDADAGQSLTWSITGGNTGNVFAINSSTGQITVNGSLDYEALSSYLLTIQVTDNGNPVKSTTATATINIADIAELPNLHTPVINDQTFSVSENSIMGLGVGTVIASDADPGQTLTYSITAGNPGNVFSINSSTGQITVSGPLDYETQSEYPLTIQVKDNGSPFRTASATVTVNINDVPEVSCAGTVVTIPSLPYVNNASTCGKGSHYNPSCSSPTYFGGEDHLFKFTATKHGCIRVGVTNYSPSSGSTCAQGTFTSLPPGSQDTDADASCYCIRSDENNDGGIVVNENFQSWSYTGYSTNPGSTSATCENASSNNFTPVTTNVASGGVTYSLRDAAVAPQCPPRNTPGSCSWAGSDGYVMLNNTSNASFTTSVLTNVTTIDLNLSWTGNDRSAVLLKSTDGGATWDEVEVLEGDDCSREGVNFTGIEIDEPSVMLRIIPDPDNRQRVRIHDLIVRSSSAGSTAEWICQGGVNGSGTVGVAMFNSCPTSAGNCIGLATAQGNPTPDAVIASVPVVMGQTYYILVSSGSIPNCGTFSINVDYVVCAPPPLPDEPQGIECGSNLGFENGDLSSWTGCHYDGNDDDNCCPLLCDEPGLVSNSGATLGSCEDNDNIGGRHVVTSGTGKDPNTDNIVPVVAPGGRNFSARLGNHENGNQAECMTQTFIVTPDNVLFTYMYAVVFEDPADHQEDDKPRFSITITNQNNTPVQCGEYNITSSSSATGGFIRAVNPSCASESGNNRRVFYKNWTAVGTDLTAYMGQPITIKFCTADCAQGGHYGYAYLDTYCKKKEVSGSQVCDTASTATLVAPYGFNNYEWSTGGAYVGSTQIINVPPVNGTVYKVRFEAVPGSGCFTEIETTLDIRSCQVLPVEFLDLSVKAVGESVRVKWDVAMERDNDYFVVERSADGKTFEAIGYVESEGNINIAHSYGFVDTHPLSGLNYYRVKQVDMNRAVSFSPVKSIYFNQFSINVFPNPSNSKFNVVITAQNSDLINLKLYDVTGRLMFSQELQPVIGINEFSFEVKDYSEGIYFLQVVAGDEKNVEKLVIKK